MFKKRMIVCIILHKKMKVAVVVDAEKVVDVVVVVKVA